MKNQTTPTTRISANSKQLTANSLQFTADSLQLTVSGKDTNTSAAAICSKIKDKLMISVQRTRINLTTNSNINTLTSIFHFGGIPPPVAADTG